eukprot:comp12758_c0_seq1/m.7879 comp12758_c0_seq1/g.7879  ORF comp12758_c0_seq1/g.7879 comp12758_c0_seq1/m.7879 type:complete len:567 (-) comp12758_c0_seq1:101-1801(-)
MSVLIDGKRLRHEPDQEDGIDQIIPEFPLKLIRDPIHDTIELSPLACHFINTPTFQRLRNLKQLGVSSYVYPGATHTRFEHSLGAYHLARKWVDTLKRNHRNNLDVDYRDKECVGLAGLLHDIGHGPFSHVFDGQFMPRVLPNADKSTLWKHEKGSVMLFDHMIEDLEAQADGNDESPLVTCLTKNDRNLIKALILGDRDMAVGEDREKLWLFDIVANQRNSVDVDKFDYLARDSYNTGINSGFTDPSRLMELSLVLSNEICFKMDLAESLYDLFQSRYRMHKRVYTHRVSRAVEHMIVDALVYANEEFKLHEAVHSPEKYLKLDDTILSRISNSESTSEGMKKAQAIIDNLNRRKIYKMADQFNSTVLEVPNFQGSVSSKIEVPKESLEHHRALFKKITPEFVATHAPHAANITEEDVILDSVFIDYAMKDKDPVNNIHFFSRWQDQNSTPFDLNRSQVSRLLPAEFQERFFRVYCRKPDQEGHLQTAFRKAMREVYGDTAKYYIEQSQTIPCPESPVKRRKEQTCTPHHTPHQTPLKEGVGNEEGSRKKMKTTTANLNVQFNEG